MHFASSTKVASMKTSRRFHSSFLKEAARDYTEHLQHVHLRRKLQSPETDDGDRPGFLGFLNTKLNHFYENGPPKWSAVL